MPTSLFWGYGAWGATVWGPTVVAPYAPGNPLTSTMPANPDAPWRDGPSTYELLITRPGDLTPTVMTTSGVSAGWQYTGQTQFSGEVTTDALLDTFGFTDLRGYWLRWNHATLGTWAGQITECEADLSTGTTEIAATDFSSLLAARRMTKIYDVPSATAGALFKRIITDAQRDTDNYSWIRTINADETGDPLKWQVRGDNVLDGIQTLESRSNEEWWVDENRVAWWQRRRGSNKTGSVQLVEGIHIVTARYTVALGPVVNDLRVIPASEDYAISESFHIDDDDSIKRFGRRQAQLTYTTGVSKATLLPVARRDLARLKSLGDTIEFDVVNIAINDSTCAFASFREGDSILLLLPSANRAMQVRVLVRSYDTENGVLRVSADVE